jgi:hypothetical protein
MMTETGNEMTTTTVGKSLEVQRRVVRRRAFANMLLILEEESRRSGGRFEVVGMPDAVLFRFRDVVTLVRRNAGFGVEPRDFTLIVMCPPLWPFDRAAALVPVCVEPMDFCHPNSDSRQFCIDVRGIPPERLADLLYRNISLRNRRLDHCVDHAAADYVRAHLADRPADPRPLYGPLEEMR